MLHFFYDSLDTLKKVKKPTWKEVRVFTVQVFVVVIVSAFVFLVLDNLWWNLYQQIFRTFGNPSSAIVAPSTNIQVPVVNPTINDNPWIEIVPADEIDAEAMLEEPTEETVPVE
jgi:preprotein translocase subunit SecE